MNKTWPDTDLLISTDQERWHFLEERIKKEGSIKLTLDPGAPDDFPIGFAYRRQVADSLPMLVDLLIGLNR